MFGRRERRVSAVSKNLRFVLERRPVGMFSPEDFRAVREPVPQPGPGQALVKQVLMSLDPAMRGWMDANPDSYIAPVELGATMRSSGAGVVEASNIPGLAVGTAVAGMLGWTEYALVAEQEVTPLPAEVPLELAVAVLGLSAATAWYGLFEIGRPNAGETLLVSGAAGAVGSLVGQLAKAEGLRVIGLAGTADKCKWLVDELGFDGAINYKEQGIAARLARLAPDGIDLCFENVGGAGLQVAIDHMNTRGRVVMCGLISQYNVEGPVAGPDLMRVITKRLRIEGFAMTDHFDRFGEFATKVAAYVQAGKVKYRTHIEQGLEQAPQALAKLFDGSNRGKLMIQVSPDSRG